MARIWIWLHLLIVFSNTLISASSPNRTSLAETEAKAEPSNLLKNNTQPWFNSRNNSWVSDLLPNNILKCSQNGTISVLTAHCATYNHASDLLEVGKCLYSYSGKYSSIGVVYTPLPITTEEMNLYTCESFNRVGTLCGKCKDGFYPVAYSYDMNCIECPRGRRNWWKFVLIAFLPLTLFYFVVLLFKINITSYYKGFFFYSQFISMPAMMRLNLITVRHYPGLVTPMRSLAVLYGIWNLDFFRSLPLGICLGTDTLQTLALDLAVGIYPILLMVLTYFLIGLYDRNFRPLIILWKPFRAIFRLFKSSWDAKTSLTDAFITFFILTNLKFLSTCGDLLAPVKVYQVSEDGMLEVSWRLFYSAEVQYFGPNHLPYAVLGITMMIFFIILPIPVIALYSTSWFQKLLNCSPIRRHILRTFMDSFQASYKDGTQPGTRDYRYFASTFFILRLSLLIIGVETLSAMYYPIASIVLVLFVILLVNAEPFKQRHYIVNNAVFLLLLALSYVITIAINNATYKLMLLIAGAVALVLVLPLVYISAITLHWLYKHRRFGLELMEKLRVRRDGYQMLE